MQNQPDIHESSGSISDDSSDHSRLLVSQSLWQALTTNAKRKAKSILVSKKLPRALKLSFRAELGINLGNKMLMPPLKKSPFQRLIELFFDCYDVSHECPDKKKVIKNLNNSVDEPVPLRCRLSILKALYQKLMEKSCSCSYENLHGIFPFILQDPN